MVPEVIATNYQQLYVQGVARATQFVDYLHTVQARSEAEGTLSASSAEARFLLMQEALIDAPTARMMQVVGGRLEEELAPRGVHNIGIVLLGSNACGSRKMELGEAVGDIDSAFLYSSDYRLPDAAFVQVEHQMSRLVREYQEQEGMQPRELCGILNPTNLHFPNLTSIDQGMRELEVLDRGESLYYSNGKPRSQAVRLLYCCLLSQPAVINDQNRAVIRDSLSLLARKDPAVWERVTGMLKQEWGRMVMPLKVKYLFGPEFECGSAEEERRKIEDTFGKQQAGEVYTLLTEANTVVAESFAAFLDETAVMTIRDRRSGHQEEQM